MYFQFSFIWKMVGSYSTNGLKFGTWGGAISDYRLLLILKCKGQSEVIQCICDF